MYLAHSKCINRFNRMFYNRHLYAQLIVFSVFLGYDFDLQGDIYARPRRRKHHKSSYHQNSDLEDFVSETMSHHSYSSSKAHTSRVDAAWVLSIPQYPLINIYITTSHPLFHTTHAFTHSLPLGESPYSLINHGANLETASNYSRPSRVKHYQDSDSEISSFSSSRYPQGKNRLTIFHPV